MKYLIKPGRSLQGQVKVDGDKSISHRSIIFGSVAEGTTRISDILEGEDVLATIAAFRHMGIQIERVSNPEQHGSYIIHGVGLNGLKQPRESLDMGNSGTAFRLLTGLMCGQPWSTTLTGDASLTGRPMGRIMTPLGLMGANISARGGRPPLTINPASGLHGIRYEMPIASAQVKSALLLAGLYATGETAVSEPAPTRDHTERMLRGFGYPVKSDDRWISISGGGRLSACDIKVPADLSSATFFILAGLVSPDSEIVLPRVGMNPTRNGVLPILQRMGADICLQNHSEMGGEPVADILVRSSKLYGTRLEGDDIALAVDEIPAIAVAAACADGVTEICGAEELRVKESDRISTTVQGLRALGIKVEEQPDGMTITGGKFSGGAVDSHGDHRIAMAFAIAGNIASHPVSILDTACVATSFPGFQALARGAGMELEQV